MCDEPEPEITSKYTMLFTDDNKANYICGSKGYENDMGVKEDEITKTDITTIEKYDYSIEIDLRKNKEGEIEYKEDDKRNTISFMSVNSIEEGIEWYRSNYPLMPEELYPLMARWNWGDLGTLTKKDIKNDNKRIKKGKKPKQMGLEVKTGTFKVEFD
tara:strand:+ start:650 stop:1123 length:474 start_codon:yes stop_codon:yes gene_type:complete